MSRMTGSAWKRGCQNKAMLRDGRGTSSAIVCRSLRRFCVWRSGTQATRSVQRAMANAAMNPPTVATTLR